MILATVSSTEVQTKSGNSTRTGKPYSIREQTVMLAMPNGELRQHSLSLEANEPPLEKGKYQPGPRAVYLDKFNLVISSRARDWVKAG